MQATWQDIKDLFRQAGEVIRADVGMRMDGSPKGSGTVVFVEPEGARAAIGAFSFLSMADEIEMFNGYDWFGSVLEVREVSLLLFSIDGSMLIFSRTDLPAKVEAVSEVALEEDSLLASGVDLVVDSVVVVSEVDSVEASNPDSVVVIWA